MKCAILILIFAFTYTYMNAISPRSNNFSSVVHAMSNPKSPKMSVGKQASGIQTEININDGTVILAGGITAMVDECIRLT